MVNDLIDTELEKSNMPIVLSGISLGGMLAYQVACLNKKVSGLIVTSLADTRKNLFKWDWLGINYLEPYLLFY